MSVYASQRTISKVQFVATAQELMTYTLEQTSKFPKSYRFNLVDSLYHLSYEIFDNVIRANSIYMYKSMTDKDFNQRHEYLTKARAALFSLSGIMTTIYNLLRKGNNFLGEKGKTTNIFMQWAKLINTEAKLINGVIKSDKKRFGVWLKEGTIRQTPMPDSPEEVNEEIIVDEESFVD